MRQPCSDIQIPEEFTGPDGGWFTRTTIETEAEMIDRIKECVKDIKEMAKESPDETVLMISHGCFLRALMLFMTNQHSSLKGSNF